MRPQITVFLRSKDGPYQQLLIQQNVRNHSVEFVETLHGIAAADPFSPRAEYPVYLRTVRDITSRVCLFINQPLAAVNPFFVEALFIEAVRSDCGLVSGVSVDTAKRVLGSSGIFRASMLQERNSPAREVAAVKDYFFALRKECLAAAGGLSILSPSNMCAAALRLTEEAHNRGLRVLETPCAVATVGRV